MSHLRQHHGYDPRATPATARLLVAVRSLAFVREVLNRREPEHRLSELLADEVVTKSP
jgi:hypothetical protein